MGSFIAATLCCLVVTTLAFTFMVEADGTRRTRGNRGIRGQTRSPQEGIEISRRTAKGLTRTRRPRTTSTVDDPRVKLLDLRLNSTSAATTPVSDHVTSSGSAPGTCGKSSFVDGLTEVRVVNGRRALPHEFPWNAFLIIYKESTNEYIGCGSTLISNNMVLTAAHCCGVTEFPHNIKVQLGSDGNRMQYEYEEYAEEIIYHPDWYSYSFSHDVCLLKIPRVEFSDKITPICLPTGCHDCPTDSDQEATVIGWGHTYTGGNFVDWLNKANVSMVDEYSCVQLFGYRWDDSMICTVGKNNTNVCNGDSGGSLSVIKSDGSYTQCGIASYRKAGSRCGETPTVFSKVCLVTEWIQSYIDQYQTSIELD